MQSPGVFTGGATLTVRARHRIPALKQAAGQEPGFQGSADDGFREPAALRAAALWSVHVVLQRGVSAVC